MAGIVVSAELRALVREVADDHPQADPREIARHVAKLTPEEDLQNFYAESLVDVVAQILGAQRRDAMGEKKDESPSDNKSSKLERRRNWWKDLLAARVHVGKSEWKIIASCTVDDLEFCIGERQSHITGLEAQIQNFRRLATLMVKHGARTVAELPPQTTWETTK